MQKVRKKDRLNRVGIALFLTILIVSVLTACGKSADNIDTAQSSTEASDTENTTKLSENNNLSGVIPTELEYIPDGYAKPAEHQGTLEKLTYDTWESFTYEQHSQKLTKEAWVYLPYGYTEEQKYNVMYLSHGGWSNETTIMGTDTNPNSFKNVIDHAI